MSGAQTARRRKRSSLWTSIWQTRARIFKLLRSPRIDSNESLSRAYVAWRPVKQSSSYSVPRAHRLFWNSSTVEKGGEEGGNGTCTTYFCQWWLWRGVICGQIVLNDLLRARLSLMIWLIPLPLYRQKARPATQEDLERGTTCWRERGGKGVGEEPIQTTAKSLVLCKSFNIFWWRHCLTCG